MMHPGMMAENRPTKNVPGVPDGHLIGAGHFHMQWNETQHLTGSTILLPRSLLPYDRNSTVLEDLFGAIGFRFDIENRYINSRSELAQNSNAVAKIAGQDAIALHKIHLPH